MNSVNRNIIILTLITGLVIAFVDVILHSVFWTLHVGFEIVELLVEGVITYFFSTGHHKSEIIGLYFLLVLGLIFLFWSLHSIQRAAFHCVANIGDWWQISRSRTYLYWRRLSIVEKVKLVSTASACAGSLALLLTL